MSWEICDKCMTAEIICPNVDNSANCDKCMAAEIICPNVDNSANRHLWLRDYLD